MKKSHSLFLAMALFTLLSHAQMTIIGHTKLNNSPLPNTDVIVKDGNTVVKSLNTKNKSEFMLKLEFGKLYRVYVQHANCPVMYFEVQGDKIPLDKYDYRMGYELDIPFCNSADTDIDSTVFKDPFHKVIYNGKNGLRDDEAYNTAFAKSILRKPAPAAPPPPPPAAVAKTIPKEEPKVEEKAPEPPKNGPATLVGKVLLNDNPQLPVINKTVSIIDRNGKVIKTTVTNRYGSFVFSNIPLDAVAKLAIDANENDAMNGMFSLMSTKQTTVAKARPGVNGCEWPLDPEQLASLVDNNYTTNIGGKLVSSSPKEKKFFAGKTVYLSNKFNTVLQKTKTNLFGTFVFEGLKPDNTYYIGVDKADLVPGEKVDFLSKEDTYISTLDTMVSQRASMRLNTSPDNETYNSMSIGETDMKMDIKGAIYGDNVNTPIGKLKVILLNDEYQVIDSVLTDDFGTFKFKYLPFLKRFFLSAENSDNILDVYKNILIYSTDDNLIKIMTHTKGKKFSYNPVSAEMSRMRDIELDDPWLEFVGDKKDKKPAGNDGYRNVLNPAPKSIVENILFENGKYEITKPSKEILDKVILVLNTNKKLKIEIGAHTDSKGSSESNMALSQLRAKTVQKYITAAGIDPARIISKGYGETRLRNGCGDNKPCSEMEHAMNRRIEFKILGE